MSLETVPVKKLKHSDMASLFDEGMTDIEIIFYEHETGNGDNDGRRKEKPVARLKTLKALLSRVTFFKKAFTSGMRETRSNKFDMTLLEGETISSLVSLIDALSSSMISKTFEKIIDEEEISSSRFSFLQSIYQRLDQVSSSFFFLIAHQTFF